MPVSGHEETRVKSYAVQFSDLTAGVPIKKRRFPLIQPFPPLSEEKCSVTEETELLGKEHWSTPQGSTLPNASIADVPIKKRKFPLIRSSSSPLEEPSSLPEENDAFHKEHSSTSQGSTLSTSSSGVSDTNKNPAFEEREENSDVTDANVVENNVNYLRPKLEKPNLATHLRTLDVVDSKEKMITNESSSTLVKEHSSASQGSTLSTTSSGLSDTNKNPAFEERKENSDVTDANVVQNTVSYVRPKLEKPNLATQLWTLDVVDSKEKMITNESSRTLLKEHSSTSQGSTLSTSSSGLSYTNKNPAFEGRKENSDVTDANMVQRNVNYVRPKLEEANLATHLRTLDVVDSKEKMITSVSYDEKLGSQMFKGNPELMLVAKEGLALNIGADISDQIVQEKSKQDSCLVPRSTDLSLGLKEHLIVASQGVDESCQKVEKVEPVSLKLSLSKEECCMQNLNGDNKTNSGVACIHSNRANWDLNTTMDAWKESGVDATLGKTSLDGLKVSGGTSNEKHFMCSPGMIPTGTTGVASLNQIHAESQNIPFTISSRLYDQKYKCVDPCNLCLSSSSIQKYAEGPSRLSVNKNSGNDIPAVSLSSVVASAGVVNVANFRMVKSEQLDENLKQDLKESNSCHRGSLDGVTVKHELVECANVESFKPSTGNNLKTLDPKFIKSEPGHKNNLERPDTTESKSDQLATELSQGSDNCSVKVKRICSKSNDQKILDPKFIKSEPGHKNNLERVKTTESTELSQGSDNCSSAEAKPICSAGTLPVSAETVPVSAETVPLSAETVYPLAKPTCSTEISTTGSIVNHLQNHASTEGPCVDNTVSQGICSCAEQAPPETVAIATVDNVTESSCPGRNDSIGTKEGNADYPEGCRLKIMSELPSDARGSGEGCVSDDEKITLSADMLEDDCYGFDYESDGTHSLTVVMDIEQYGEEDDDYEDGEVRELLEHSPAEDTICVVREVERLECSSYENKQMEKGLLSGDCTSSSHFEETDHKTVTSCEINSDKDGLGTELNEKSGKLTDRNLCLQESLDAGQPTVGSDGKEPLKALQRKSLDISERKIIPKSLETELLSDQATNGSQGIDVSQCVDEVVKKPDVVRITDPDFPKVEASANIDDATKDVSNGGNQGRIINLSKATDASSPSKTRSISGRALPSRAGRDILSDALDGDKLPRRRDEVYIDGRHRFSREWHQDMSPRNSRLNFVRGRGRVNCRVDTLCGEWESAREFSGEFYNGPCQIRAPRHKYAFAIPNADLEYNNVEPDGSYVGNGRVGRKTLNEDGPLCHHIASRRRLPRGRESIQMGHRIPRTMSPSRCVGDDCFELAGMKHSEKFMRGFREDPLDPMIRHPQPFEGLDGQFTRGSRNFSTIQRRDLPRIHSKSPIRSRSRSPGPWSSPRRRSPRRSPDGFDGHPELAHERSPVYRVDRMRSPRRLVFPGERVVRRHGSPSYVSRPSDNIRDIDSGGDHSHPRSVISNRSPSGRVLLRNRRFNVVDPQDRADNDEYFEGPMHSGRLLEFNGDERRRLGERRGPVRSFRPPYSCAVGENFHLDAEDGPRNYRFCTDDADFHERSSLRERNFDRFIKSRPANVPLRRTRNIDEQEANYGHGGQVWSDDGFDDVSRVKRKRF